MLITGALIGGHQDERDLKSQMETKEEDRKVAGMSAVNGLGEQKDKS